MTCPSCGLMIPPGSNKCDCGYDFARDAPAQRTKGTIRRRIGLAIGGIVLGCALGIVFGTYSIYGTLSPCEMLKKDLQSTLMKTITKQALKPTQSPWEQAGTALGLAFGAAISGPMIDIFVRELGPFQCIRGLARLNLSGEDPLADVKSRGGTPQAATPMLDWRKELKLRRSNYTVEHGYAMFEGEVENVGTHTIKSLTLRVYFYNRNGKEIGQESQAIVYGFSDPMRPGHVKPFTVMTKVTSALGDNIKYVFVIEDYELQRSSLIP